MNLSWNDGLVWNDSIPVWNGFIPDLNWRVLVWKEFIPDWNIFAPCHKINTDKAKYFMSNSSLRLLEKTLQWFWRKRNADKWSKWRYYPYTFTDIGAVSLVSLASITFPVLIVLSLSFSLKILLQKLAQISRWNNRRFTQIGAVFLLSRVLIILASKVPSHTFREIGADFKVES